MVNQKSPSNDFAFAEILLSSIPSRQPQYKQGKRKHGVEYVYKSGLRIRLVFLHVPGIRRIINHCYIFCEYLFPSENRTIDLIVILH